MVKIQVAAGRNLAVLVEAAVRNTILRLRGIDTLRDFMDRQRAAMQAEAASHSPQGRLL
jgi:HPr kinase/phosphorylase